MALTNPSTPLRFCVRCHLAIGSAEECIPSVYRGVEGPSHLFCATPAEVKIHRARLARTVQQLSAMEFQVADAS